MAAWVAQQQAAAVPPATSMMARVDRLDLVLGYLEEMTHHHQQHGGHHATTTAASAGAWSPSSTASSSSPASTPRPGSKTWRRRPAKEAQAKGTLVDRIALLEDRVLKMEEDMHINITPEKMMNTMSPSSKRKKGLKSLVKSCVRGKLKTKD